MVPERVGADEQATVAGLDARGDLVQDRLQCAASRGGVQIVSGNPDHDVE